MWVKRLAVRDRMSLLSERYFKSIYLHLWLFKVDRPVRDNAGMWRSAVLLFCLLSIAVSRNAQPAQRVRDEWGYLEHLDVNADLPYSLAGVPIPGAEKEQIYRVLDEMIHADFSAARRNEEREAVLSARVGFIALNDSGNQQLMVRGSKGLCGAQNCALLLFVRNHGRWKLALSAEGGTFLIKKTTSQGFHDVATVFHMSAKLDFIHLRTDKQS